MARSGRSPGGGSGHLTAVVDVGSSAFRLLLVDRHPDGTWDVVDRAVRAGVRGVLNFAPARLHVPDGVELKNVNIVMELEALSFALSRPPDPDDD